MVPYFDQSSFTVRSEWGLDGLRNLASSDVVIIVDVLSFTTSVEIATSRGATVLPFPSRNDSAEEYAAQQGATLAGRRSSDHRVPNLSPSSLEAIERGTKLVLPSPNGSTLAFEAASSGASVVAGSLRNASAVASWAHKKGALVTVVPAGERWPDGTLRPCLEDSLGVGAIVRALNGHRSPEAASHVAAFENANINLVDILENCSSGRELIERGFGQDVSLAAELDASETVPLLEDGAFSAAMA